tara:strand:+ start:87 stop:248 length:162 start_codon:yes stop_codon:yes gene_type:complete
MKFAGLDNILVNLSGGIREVYIFTIALKPFYTRLLQIIYTDEDAPDYLIKTIN